jgi:hypothetical protein
MSSAAVVSPSLELRYEADTLPGAVEGDPGVAGHRDELATIV